MVTPQNTPTIPQPAQRAAGRPRIGPITQPRVAPIKNEGTISPPLNLAPRVAAVKINLHIKRPWRNRAFKAASNHRHAGTIVIIGM